MDADTLLNLALVLLFVLIGGVFAGTEMAIVNLREGQIHRIESSGPRGRRTAELVRNPNRFLAAVQIGVTVAGFFSSAYGAATIAPDLVPVLEAAGVPGGLADTAALVLLTLLIAYLSLVFGELVPKRIAMQRAVGFTRIAAPPLGVFAAAMKPAIWFLSASTNVVVRLLGGDPSVRTSAVSAEEVKALVAQSREIPEQHRRILEDVFEAAERTVQEVMRPRPQVDFLAASLSIGDALAAAGRFGHSRYPVYGRDHDDLVGFVHVLDLVRAAGRREEGDAGAGTVGSIARPVAVFPGSVNALAALARLRAEGQQLAVVVDEYGGTDGIVALEDLLEEIVGEIYDEYDVRAELSGVPGAVGGTLVVDGSLIVQELPDVAGIAVPDSGAYETLGGYIMDVLGRLAVVGDVVEGPGFRLEVQSMDRRRIVRVGVERTAAADGGGAGDTPGSPR
ncbi:hemolysin family protein [Zafaria sp. Z1313]|uniref:hemolysin family protein n=1 Tax=unclassified Zafaria TaxID=2828765 RepID=UPI002E7A2F69|nr:hemolysin family protein [Zafaria sp. J156]MEE1622061.1 hemolysin family protein [Zafaria sp. J156]